MTDMLTGITPVLAGPWAILAVIVLLAGWATASGYRLLMRTDKLMAELKRATGLIERTSGARGFADRFDAVAPDLADNTVLGSRWQAWQPTLLRQPDGLIRATERSEDWFDLGLLRAPSVGLDPRYHAALPGLLVGAGLLFTFFGLAIALHSASGIVAADVTQAQRNAALHELLSAASFKFWTSVAGLLLSILYALFRKARLHKVETALETFRAALDARAPLVTAVQLQAETNALLRSAVPQ
jgi:hypothetical protein